MDAHATTVYSFLCMPAEHIVKTYTTDWAAHDLQVIQYAAFIHPEASICTAFTAAVASLPPSSSSAFM